MATSAPPANEATVASVSSMVLRQIAPTRHPQDAIEHATIIYMRNAARGANCDAFCAFGDHPGPATWVGVPNAINIRSLSTARGRQSAAKVPA
jgi:hypothetical protein